MIRLVKTEKTYRESFINLLASKISEKELKAFDELIIEIFEEGKKNQNT